MTERLSNKNPCNDCKVDRQIGNPNRWECECDRCDKPNDWKNECVKKLAEYENAEEEGRVLPCKVWNKVYIIDRYYLYKRESVVTKIEMDEDGLKIMIRDEIPVYSSGYNISDFGKTVFLTEGEADRVLREIEEKI